MFIRFKYISIIVSIFIVLIFFYSRWTLKSSADRSRTFVVGMMSGWAPFMTINSAGEYEGFDIDVAQKIADRINKKLEIKDFGALATLLVALQQNKVDCIMSGLDITQSRTNVMDMVPYTGETVKSFYLLFWNKIPYGIRSIEDLQKINDAIICAEPGSAQAKYLEQFKYIYIKSLSKIEDMILDIKYSKSLAAIVEPRVAKRFMLKNPELKKLELVLPEDFQTFGMGIAFNKNNSLTQMIKTIIQDLKNDGTLARLEKKWGLAIDEE